MTGVSGNSLLPYKFVGNSHEFLRQTGIPTHHCKEALHVLLRLDRKLGKCNTKYGRYVYCTAAAWSEYFPEKFPRISQHLAENSRGPPSWLIIRLNIYIFHFPAFFRSPAVHYGGKCTLKRRRERFTLLPNPSP